MAQVFRSGAFLQQCWSVHPLCIAVKRLVDDRTLILSCSSCRSVHHLALGPVTVRASVVSADPQDTERPGEADDGGARLTECLQAHAAALSLRDMDVFRDQALIRCAECRRHYALAVTAFETHHK